MLEFLIRAEASSLGIKVKSHDARRLQNQLIALRAKNKRFAALSIKLSPLDPEGEVWIVKMDGEL